MVDVITLDSDGIKNQLSAIRPKTIFSGYTFCIFGMSEAEHQRLRTG